MISAYQSKAGITPKFPMILRSGGSDKLANLFTMPGYGGPTWIMHPDLEWVQTTYSQPKLNNDMQAAIFDDCDGGDMEDFVEVKTPNGGEFYNLGEEITIEWFTNDTGNVDISLLKNGNLVKEIGTTSATTSGKQGSFKWTIPTDLKAGDNFTLVVASQSTSEADTSNSSFTILPYGKIVQSTISVEDYSPYMIYGDVEYDPGKALDGDAETWWNNELVIPGFKGTLPAFVTYKLDKEYSLVGFSHLPRAEKNGQAEIKDYKLEVSSNGVQWTSAQRGSFPNELDVQVVEFDKVDKVRYVKFTAITSYAEFNWVSSAEFNLFYDAGNTGVVSGGQNKKMDNAIRMVATNKVIQIALEKRDRATVNILSVSGRVVSSYALSDYSVGTTSLKLPDNLSTGIYLVQFVGESVRSVKAVNIVK